jgi:hypothetical protein
MVSGIGCCCRIGADCGNATKCGVALVTSLRATPGHVSVDDDDADAEDSFEATVVPLNVEEEDGGEVYRGGGSGFGGLATLGGRGREAAESILAYLTDAVTQQEVVPLMGESVRFRASARIGV